MALRDKTGREIMLGDILKVFHFVGARNKRHYMYKQAIDLTPLGKSGNLYWRFSHLDMSDNSYVERDDARTLRDYEIVQSAGADFEERPRGTAALAQHPGADHAR